jgi:hypothetical protein
MQDAHAEAHASFTGETGQSAGKRLGGRTTQGNPWLRAALGEVTWSTSHPSISYLAAQYHRFARRIGKHKAIVAVSYSLLVIIYHLLAVTQRFFAR